MSAHTPGPWRIVGADGHALAIWGANAEDVVSEKRVPMRQEDARLIAAAPELLGALKRLLRDTVRIDVDESRRWHYDSSGERFACFRETRPMCLARAAIAKAEGP